METTGCETGKEEIEVTEEMIEAGFGEAMNFNPQFHDTKEMVIDVYRAMFLVSRRSR